MRATVLIAVLYVLAQALSLAVAGAARAEANAVADASASAKKGLPWEKSATTPATSKTETAPVAEPEAVDAAGPTPPHPVVPIIREKLADPTVTKGAEPEDIAALQAFYRARGAPPLWITDMGFSAKGQAALFEIAKADDWGLEAKDFALPDSNALPENETTQALAEIKLDLAILKYARFARGARHVPSEISELLDLEPPLRNPRRIFQFARIFGQLEEPAFVTRDCS